MRKKNNAQIKTISNYAPVLWDSTTLSEALGQAVEPGISATGVSIDSRAINKGEIFVAIIGDSFNGNEFALEALKKGASLAIVDNSAINLKGYAAQVICVDDTLQALNKLAYYARARIKGKLIGVTGSVGKTSTKEMLKLALEGQGECYASKGNFNNHWGLPLCMANMPAATDYAVIEMGMSSAGEMRHLSLLAKPDVAIITTIEAVHLEFFNSVSAIAAAKSEIFEGMDKGATAIVNHDNPYHQIILGFARDKGLNALSFGSSQKTNFKIENYEAVNGKSHIKAECMGRDIDYTIGVIGKHIALNSLSVLAAVYAVGAELDYAARCLAGFASHKGRGLVHKVAKRKLTLIDDCYNAAPVSVKAALSNLGTYKPNAGRLIAVLGNMMELGPKSVDMHMDLLGDITGNNVDRVYTIGHLMEHLHNKLPANIAGSHCSNASEMAEILKKDLMPGDVVLVKGSNSMKLSGIVEELIKL